MHGGLRLDDDEFGFVADSDGEVEDAGFLEIEDAVAFRATSHGRETIDHCSNSRATDGNVTGRLLGQTGRGILPLGLLVSPGE